MSEYKNESLNSLSDQELKQKNYYNQIAERYDEHYADEMALFYRDTIYEKLGFKINFKNKNLLDAMCGGGQDSIYFIRKGANVTGIDLSEEQCNIFKKRLPKNRIECGSVLQTPFKDEEFDVIYLNSLHHLHPNVNNAIQEFKRILKPKGYIILWEPSSESLLDIFRRIWYKLDKNLFLDNEKSINLRKLEKSHINDLTLIQKSYGGNIGYLFVFLSMELRLPIGFNKFYGKLFIKLEQFLSLFQLKLFSLWFLAVFQKNDENQTLEKI